MHILSINQELSHPNLKIHSISLSQLSQIKEIEKYDYIVLSGGDGTIRRTVKTLQDKSLNACFILNPSGSFNVIAKQHSVPQVTAILEQIAKGNDIQHKTQAYHSLNDEIFLFSAGNMGDLQHIFLAENLRFGWLKKGMFKYVLAVIFLLPFHLLMTPVMLLNSQKFFIFTPLHFIKKFGTFYGKVNTMEIDLKNDYNIIELDGDLVTIPSAILKIKEEGHIKIATL